MRKTLLMATAILAALNISISFASEESKTWPASDDMFTTKPTMDFVAKNAAMYADGGYMVSAFNRGASGCGELAKILPAITDELWKMGYSNDDLEKIYGRNKMRVYRKVWEGFAPEDDPVDADKRYDYINEMRNRFQSR